MNKASGGKKSGESCRKERNSEHVPLFVRDSAAFSFDTPYRQNTHVVRWI